MEELQGSAAAAVPRLDDESSIISSKYYYLHCNMMTVSDDDFGDEHEAADGSGRQRESMVNKLISTVYSGPTISDIESALSFTGAGGDQQIAVMDNAPPVVFSPEKVLSKMENKYTLKIKTCGNGGLAEDGYKWRKYGQKSIKNSPNPRSYYRCTNPRCNAKKQVERARDEADTLLVTYEGLHLHYTYSHFLQQQQQQPAAGAGGGKKPKLQARGGPPAADVVADAATTQEEEEEEEDLLLSSRRRSPAAAHEHEQMLLSSPATSWASDDGGLLEDVVPLLVRRPAGCTTTPAAQSSPSMSSAWNYMDMALLSNIF
ncbi:unnamed protein product [Urochloa humidicola]